MFLARKISFPKWNTHQDLAEGELQADAITADLRTADNALSVWCCGDEKATDNDIQEAVLAMASMMDRANKIDVVWIDKAELDIAGYPVYQTDGAANVRELVSLHYDICGLDYTRLGVVACLIQRAIAEKQYRNFRRQQILELLVVAADKGRLEPKNLKPALHKEVEEALIKLRSLQAD